MSNGESLSQGTFWRALRPLLPRPTSTTSARGSCKERASYAYLVVPSWRPQQMVQETRAVAQNRLIYAANYVIRRWESARNVLQSSGAKLRKEERPRRGCRSSQEEGPVLWRLTLFLRILRAITMLVRSRFWKGSRPSSGGLGCT